MLSIYKGQRKAQLQTTQKTAKERYVSAIGCICNILM